MKNINKRIIIISTLITMFIITIILCLPNKKEIILDEVKLRKKVDKKCFQCISKIQIGL